MEQRQHLITYESSIHRPSSKTFNRRKKKCIAFIRHNVRMFTLDCLQPSPRGILCSHGYRLVSPTLTVYILVTQINWHFIIVSSYSLCQAGDLSCFHPAIVYINRKGLRVWSINVTSRSTWIWPCLAIKEIQTGTVNIVKGVGLRGEGLMMEQNILKVLELCIFEGFLDCWSWWLNNFKAIYWSHLRWYR